MPFMRQRVFPQSVAIHSSKENVIVSDAIVHVTNHSTRDLFIARDPNWDDQVLFLDGRRLNRAHRLGPEESADVSVPMGPNDGAKEYLMGVIFADGRDYDYGSAGAYQMAIGHHSETGLLGVTDESTIKRPAMRYTMTDHAPWSVRMDFVDAPADEPAAPPRGLAY
jgi:hypothetical protein